MKKRYQINVIGNTVVIRDNVNGTIKEYFVQEFVYGQAMYNEQTDKYPNYVHDAVWAKYKR